MMQMQIFAIFYIFLLDITQNRNYNKSKSNPFLKKFVDVLNGRPQTRLLHRLSAAGNCADAQAGHPFSSKIGDI